ncbi:TraR/DksA family transcriptional regulator [Kordiimonas marina]|uniref:TraR/DksA family transcriptional regulator n=1 Tax=Kordiimonas marina TaxID=2872312 RepID=UPI001FF66A68|nr:TraR/DksA family transcriptional regulator [Kordiimonas marina]MCJ9428887.1 TraR/DksA family transcriptional regulator [Kordiimonas marina]
MTDADIRARLNTLKAELEAMDHSSEESRGTVELDQSRVGRLSRMDALQGQAMNQAIAARRRQALQKVEAALQRLDEGEYGYCVRCGEEISPKRLDLDPAAALCTDCTSGKG